MCDIDVVADDEDEDAALFNAIVIASSGLFKDPFLYLLLIRLRFLVVIDIVSSKLFNLKLIKREKIDL